jgi:hypothetical protein
MASCLLALGLSVALVALALCSWIAFRHRRRVTRLLGSRRCPACGAVYGLAASAASEDENVIVMDGPDVRRITCPACRAVRDWQEDGLPADSDAA